MRDERPWAGRRLHFVGIAGAGMSGLALVADGLGAAVTGSDSSDSPYLRPLRARGIEPALGHAADQLPAGDDVELVYSTAIGVDNPERIAARARGLAEIHRGDLLGEVTRLRPTIAVSGTHGKSTTAAMAVHVLRACGMDPSYLVGAELRATAANAGWGDGEWLVVEADESDRSMLALHPRIAVVTNVELDHHATYGSRAELDDAFREFLALAEMGVVWDRPELLTLSRGGDGVATFDAVEPTLSPAGSRFQWHGLEVALALPGAHNARNAAAALEACRLAGADPETAAAALADFAGTGRRFELLGTGASGARIYDDYAHHPTEVAATIAAARTLEPERVVAVFQPHLYSRTAALARAFGVSLTLADLPVVLDVYPAREHASDFPGISGRLIATATVDAAPGRRVAWMPGFDQARRFLAGELRAGDLCLCLGAGDVDSLGRGLLRPDGEADR